MSHPGFYCFLYKDQSLPEVRLYFLFASKIAYLLNARIICFFPIIQSKPLALEQNPSLLTCCLHAISMCYQYELLTTLYSSLKKKCMCLSNLLFMQLQRFSCFAFSCPLNLLPIDFM